MTDGLIVIAHCFATAGGAQLSGEHGPVGLHDADNKTVRDYLFLTMAFVAGDVGDGTVANRCGGCGGAVRGHDSSGEESCRQTVLAAWFLVPASGLAGSCESSPADKKRMKLTIIPPTGGIEPRNRLRKSSCRCMFSDSRDSDSFHSAEK